MGIFVDVVKATASITGWILTVAGIVLSIIFTKDGWQMGFFLLLILCILLSVSASIISYKYYALKKEYKTMADAPPKENSCYVDDSYMENGSFYLITARSEMYRQNCLVTLYYYDINMPKRIGYGKLYNYDNIKQYIRVIKEFDAEHYVFEGLKSKNIEYMRNTYALPIFFREYNNDLI